MPSGLPEAELMQLTMHLEDQEKQVYSGRYDEFVQIAVFRWLPLGTELRLLVTQPGRERGDPRNCFTLRTPDRPGMIHDYDIVLSR